MRQLQVGGDVVLAVPGDPTGYWSKVLRLGFTEPITVRLVGQIIEFYREQGMTRCVLQIVPEVLLPDWADICESLNISSG